jgi:hypothetical protein
VDVVQWKSTFLACKTWVLIPAQKERSDRKMKEGNREVRKAGKEKGREGGREGEWKTKGGREEEKGMEGGREGKKKEGRKVSPSYPINSIFFYFFYIFFGSYAGV